MTPDDPDAGDRPDDTRSGSESSGEEAPLGRLAADVDERRARSGEFDDLFEREDVDGIDGDALWERLESDDGAAVADREVRTIPKRTYCHRCEHFSGPPATECTNDGTDILELVSLAEFRVADCPVAMEEERLERGE